MHTVRDTVRTFLYNFGYIWDFVSSYSCSPPGRLAVGAFVRGPRTPHPQINQNTITFKVQSNRNVQRSHDTSVITHQSSRLLGYYSTCGADHPVRYQSTPSTSADRAAVDAMHAAQTTNASAASLSRSLVRRFCTTTRASAPDIIYRADLQLHHVSVDGSPRACVRP